MEYTITSTQNAVMKAIKKLNLAKERKQSGLFLTEGEKCVQEALKMAGLCVQLLVVEEDKERYHNLTSSFRGDIFWVSTTVLESIASTKSPQGIMAVCDSAKLDLKEKEGLIVVLDGVSDPGNVGTIIRTADAAGASAVYTLNESADILSPKVLRASMGSVFHMPVRHIAISEISALKGKGYTVLGADLSGDTQYTVSGKKQCLVIGSEAHGISEETLQWVDKTIKIPIYGEAESLNAGVAAGILIYKITEILHQ